MLKPLTSYALSPPLVLVTYRLDRERAIGVSSLRSSPTHGPAYAAFGFDLSSNFHLLSGHSLRQDKSGLAQFATVRAPGIEAATDFELSICAFNVNSKHPGNTSHAIVGKRDDQLVCAIAFPLPDPGR